MNTDNAKSARPCGCDEGAQHICEWHATQACIKMPSPEFEIVEFKGKPIVIPAAKYTQELTGPTNPKQPLGNKPGSDHMVEAHDIVNGDRMAAYGSPKPAYDAMALVWTGLINHKLLIPLTAEDVVILLTGMKLVREGRKHKRDNLVDIHGYALVLAHVQADGQ